MDFPKFFRQYRAGLSFFRYPIWMHPWDILELGSGRECECEERKKSPRAKWRGFDDSHCVCENHTVARKFICTSTLNDNKISPHRVFYMVMPALDTAGIPWPSACRYWKITSLVVNVRAENQGPGFCGMREHPRFGFSARHWELPAITVQWQYSLGALQSH